MHLVHLDYEECTRVLLCDDLHAYNQHRIRVKNYSVHAVIYSWHRIRVKNYTVHAVNFSHMHCIICYSAMVKGWLMSWVDCWPDMKQCDPNADLTHYLWCQRRLAADADSYRDIDSVSATAADRCRHHQCCLLADRLCAANTVPPGNRWLSYLL